MYPIALLSVCGMMLGLGSGLASDDMAKLIPFLAIPIIKTILDFIVSLGLFAFVNLPVLFAIAIPLGLLKDKEDKAYGAFSGLIGFMAMHLGTNFYLKQHDLLVVADQMSTHGQTIILGIQSYNTSVLGGIVAGLLVASMYKKIVNLRIPESLGFYSGPRLVPIITLIVMSGFGLIIPFIWPPFFNLFMLIGHWISTSGPVGYFFYAVAERVTIPFGLNHLVTSVFRYANRRFGCDWRRRILRHPEHVYGIRQRECGHSAGFGGENGAGQTDDSVWSGWCRAGDVSHCSCSKQKGYQSIAYFRGAYGDYWRRQRTD